MTGEKKIEPRSKIHCFLILRLSYSRRNSNSFSPFNHLAHVDLRSKSAEKCYNSKLSIRKRHIIVKWAIVGDHCPTFSVVKSNSILLICVIHKAYSYYMFKILYYMTLVHNNTPWRGCSRENGGVVTDTGTNQMNGKY